MSRLTQLIPYHFPFATIKAESPVDLKLNALADNCIISDHRPGGCFFVHAKNRIVTRIDINRKAFVFIKSLVTSGKANTQIYYSL